MAIKRVLEPIERISEVLFGLIMVLTFTGSLSVVADRAEVRTMLIGALGCNLAWALIDAVFYLMGCLSERAGDFRAYMAMRGATRPDELREALSHTATPLVSRTISDTELERMGDAFRQMRNAPGRAALVSEDLLGALAVFLLVFASTFPVVLPFLFFSDATWALRVSNAIAIAMLFVAGAAYGRLSGRRPLLTGGVMVALGALLVALAIALGG